MGKLGGNSALVVGSMDAPHNDDVNDNNNRHVLEATEALARSQSGAIETATKKKNVFRCLLEPDSHNKMFAGCRLLPGIVSSGNAWKRCSRLGTVFPKLF